MEGPRREHLDGLDAGVFEQLVEAGVGGALLVAEVLGGLDGAVVARVGGGDDVDGAGERLGAGQVVLERDVAAADDADVEGLGARGGGSHWCRGPSFELRCVSLASCRGTARRAPWRSSRRAAWPW